MQCSKRLRPWLAALVLAGLVSWAPPAQAASAGMELGRGLLAVLGNVVYMPAKTIYAAGGGVVAGIAWAFSGGDAEVSRPILDAALRGDYVVTLDHLARRRKIEFIGRSPAQRRAENRADWDAVSAPPPGRNPGDGL